MKSKKLSLKNLEVKSFVTAIEQKKELTLKGGAFTDFINCAETVRPRLCPSMLCPC